MSWNDLIPLLLDTRALKGIGTWPIFSVTSYRMVRRIVAEGINPATVIDVGANVGQFAVAAKKFWPNAALYAFEPNPRSFEQLSRNLAQFADVHLHNVALADFPGERRFYVNSHSHSSSLLRLGKTHLENFPEAVEVDVIYVPMTTVDLSLSGQDLREPTLLKIDVQGSDAAVLRGAVRFLSRIRWVVVELSFDELYEGEPQFSDVFRWMDQHGFELHRPVGWLIAPRTEVVLQIDALFVRKEITT